MAKLVSVVPAPAFPDATMGTLNVGSLQVQDVTAVRSLLSPNDGERHDLVLGANGVDGSSVVLGVWAAQDGSEDGSGTVQAVATVTTAGVAVTGTVAGTTLTDGVATLRGGALAGATTVFAGTVTDGVAVLTDGSLTGAAVVSATALTDGVATLRGGVLSGVTLGPQAELYIGANWRVVVGGAKNALQFQSTRDGGRTWVTKSSMNP